MIPITSQPCVLNHLSKIIITFYASRHALHISHYLAKNMEAILLCRSTSQNPLSSDFCYLDDIEIRMIIAVITSSTSCSTISSNLNVDLQLPARTACFFKDHFCYLSWPQLTFWLTDPQTTDNYSILLDYRRWMTTCWALSQSFTFRVGYCRRIKICW